MRTALNNLDVKKILDNLIIIIKEINKTNSDLVLLDNINLDIKDKCINNLLLKNIT